jgi:hypothetical protein
MKSRHNPVLVQAYEHALFEVQCCRTVSPIQRCPGSPPKDYAESPYPFREFFGVVSWGPMDDS